MSFQIKLKGLMKELGLTQAQIAKMTGVAPSGISQYLSGKNEPSEITQRKIAVALGVQENYFEELLPVAKIDTGIKIKPEDIAPLLHCDVDTIRKGLRDMRFPWGYAVQTSPKRWVYIILPIRFTQETGITIPVVSTV